MMRRFAPAVLCVLVVAFGGATGGEDEKPEQKAEQECNSERAGSGCPSRSPVYDVGLEADEERFPDPCDCPQYQYASGYLCDRHASSCYDSELVYRDDIVLAPEGFEQYCDMNEGLPPDGDCDCDLSAYVKSAKEKAITTPRYTALETWDNPSKLMPREAAEKMEIVYPRLFLQLLDDNGDPIAEGKVVVTLLLHKPESSDPKEFAPPPRLLWLGARVRQFDPTITVYQIPASDYQVANRVYRVRLPEEIPGRPRALVVFP